MIRASHVCTQLVAVLGFDRVALLVTLIFFCLVIPFAPAVRRWLRIQDPLDCVTLVVISLTLGIFVREYMLAGTITALVYGWRARQNGLVLTACLVPILFRLIWTLGQAITQRLQLRFMDSTFARLDHGAGIWVWHWCLRHPPARFALVNVYGALGGIMMLALAFTDRRRELLTAFSIATIAGWACYLVFPAVGPVWVGRGTFPNCMPSLHLTFALLSWIYAWSRLRWPFLLFALLTAAATLGTGEHYAIDLLAAIPFTYATHMVAEAISAFFLRRQGPSLQPARPSYSADSD